jgi:hypothetical protein
MGFDTTLSQFLGPLLQSPPVVVRAWLRKERAPAFSETSAGVTQTHKSRPKVSTRIWRLRPLGKVAQLLRIVLHDVPTL